LKPNIRVSRKKPESLTRQIADQINILIDTGVMAVGSALPSERELANHLKVARNVVRGAYEKLVVAGKVQLEGQKGRTVRSPATKKKPRPSKKK
jgi:DNA-binding FadR family transcriptional regulator